MRAGAAAKTRQIDTLTCTFMIFRTEWYRALDSANKKGALQVDSRKVGVPSQHRDPRYAAAR